MPSSRPKPNSEFPFHIIARCSNKEWFQVPLPEVWDLYSDYLFLISHSFEFKIHGFVLMNNHFHLIASTPKANLSTSMGYFMRETSRELGRLSNRTNQIYGRPYFASKLGTYHYFLNAYKYIYRNPLDVGFPESAEDYPYATLGALVGNFHTKIPLTEDTLLFENVDSHLRWLNTPYPTTKIRNSIRTALGHKNFKFRKNKNGMPSILESKLF